MRKVWPPIYDNFAVRLWSLIIASAITVAVTLWLVFDRDPPLGLAVVGCPGSIAALVYYGFDPDPDKSPVLANALFLSVNFVWYFVLARAFIGTFKIVKDIRNA